MAKTQGWRNFVPSECRRLVKLGRAQVFAAFGSERYAHPALFGLDDQMLGYLPERGTFLEIGANDGYSQSNTYYLEKFRGWDGILIEPLPRLFRYLRLMRKRAECFNVACVTDATATEVTIVDSDLMSVVRGQQSESDESGRIVAGASELHVPASTLSLVIEQSRFERVTFMSVDVEGAEFAVLGGLDLDRHCPDFLLVETKYPERVDAIVGSHLSRKAKLSVHDFLWTHA